MWSRDDERDEDEFQFDERLVCAISYVTVEVVHDHTCTAVYMSHVI